MAAIRSLAARILADAGEDRNKKRVREILRLLDSILEELDD